MKFLSPEPSGTGSLLSTGTLPLFPRPLGYPLGASDRLAGYVAASLARTELRRSGAERCGDLAVACSNVAGTRVIEHWVEVSFAL